MSAVRASHSGAGSNGRRLVTYTESRDLCSLVKCQLHHMVHTPVWTVARQPHRYGQPQKATAEVRSIPARQLGGAPSNTQPGQETCHKFLLARGGPQEPRSVGIPSTSASPLLSFTRRAHDQSYSCSFQIQWAMASSSAWLALLVTLLALPTFQLPWPENGWSCSRRWCRASAASQ